jgi:hypothetical protein
MSQTAKDAAKKVYVQPTLEKSEGLLDVSEGAPIRITTGPIHM